MDSEDFVAAYEQALATQDWAEVEPLIHASCSVTFSDGSSHRGAEAVEMAFVRNFAMIEGEEYAISEVHWIAQEATFAVFSFVYHWSGTISGKAVSGSGRGTSTIIRHETRWQLAAEHLGPLQP